MPRDKKNIEKTKKPKKIKLSNEFSDEVNKYESKRSKRIRRYLIKPLKIFFGTLFLLIVGVILTVVFIGVGIYLQYSHDFDGIKPQNNSTQLVMYDSNNNVIFAGYGAAQPRTVNFSAIPNFMKEATLAAEDQDFYKHGPIDFKGILRAIYTNWQQSNKSGWAKLKDLFNSDTYTQGGSTITQQLVKNIYLTPQKSFTRKIKELVYSYELEKKYTKDQILAMYLNNIYYGQQALGIENASEIYFHTDVKNLDLAQASMLAGLPQAPSDYSPITNFEASKLRQQYVLQRMYLAGEINLKTAKEAANEPLTFYGDSQTINKYPFFTEYIKEQLEKDLGTSDVTDKGYKVYTTLNSSYQNIAQNEVTIWLAKLASRSATNASVVIQDPKTDKILAMVGGANWNTSTFNVATAERQPGSSFKPIVYATALENGYTAATMLDDKYVNFGGTPPYIPEDYTGKFSGMVTVREALARSLNVPAVEMGKLVGIDNVISMAHNLGITTVDKTVANYGLSLALGSAEVKLVDMTEVYSTFANGGKRMPQIAINKIIDDNGNQIALPQRNGQQIISPESAYILSSILSDNSARTATFGSNSPLKTTMTTAVKTGTTDNYEDSWTMGYSPSLVVGVWMGNNNHTPMDQVSGSEGAAYIWHDVITNCLANQVSVDFVKPLDIQQAWINPSTGSLASYHGKPNILENFKPGTAPGLKVDLSYLKQF